MPKHPRAHETGIVCVADRDGEMLGAVNMTTLKMLMAAALLTVPVGLIGTTLVAYVVQDRTTYAHPGGIWISAPDYLTGCEAAKRSLIERGYQ